MCTENERFENFLIEEMKVVAGAHFKNTDTISNFFRHYLVIASIPLSIIGLAKVIIESTESAVNIESLIPFLIVLFYAIAIIGVFVIGYMASLRSACIIYARTVNGIRNYFYNLRSSTGPPTESIIVLPRDNAIPDFFEPCDFGFSIYALSVINGLYAGLGTYFLCSDDMITKLKQAMPLIVAIMPLTVAVLVFALGILAYFILAKAKDNYFNAP